MEDKIYTTNAEMKPQKIFFQGIQGLLGLVDFSDRFCEYLSGHVCRVGDI